VCNEYNLLNSWINLATTHRPAIENIALLLSDWRDIIINCLLYKVNEVEVDQSLGIQSAVMAALLVVGGLDCRPRIGGLVMGEGLGQGEHQQR
jgi:hypothetical protein